MSNDKSGLTLLQLNNYVKPKIEENKSRGWVTNGRNNSYFKYVNDRYIGSPTNSAILNGYRSWVYGKGLAAKDQHSKPNQYARLYSMLKAKDVMRLVADFVVHNMAYVQIIRNRDNSINSIEHVAVDKIAPEVANENNEIEAYYFSNNWEKWQREENEPQRIDAFGSSEKHSAIEIHCIKPYQMGMDYFALPSYQSGLQYAELEEEISNYSISHMKNGLSFGYIIDIPNSYNLSVEDKKKIRKSIENKLTGSSRAGTFMINFANGEVPITVTPLEVNDAHKQWEFLSKETREKLITAHEVVSPMLFGIKDATGFSSNADELAESERQTIERVVMPKQQRIIKALEEILISDDITLKLYFKEETEEKADKDSSFTGVQVTSAIDIITKVKTNELSINQASSLLRSMLSYPEEEISKLFNNNTQSTQLSTHICCSSDDGASGSVADELISLGESFNSDEWSVLCESEVNYETDEHAHDLIDLSLASTGTARPNSKSEQDSKDIVIRYKYVGNKNPQREFCKKMMSANKVYRKEDIISMSNKVVNAGFGVNGADTYDIWLYKGSVQCRHKWNRVIYLKKNGGVDVNSPLATAISTSEARRRGYKVPTNNTLVSVAPNKMPNGGAYPN